MTEGNLFSKIIIFSIPLILTALLQLFYNACDLVVCGRFGSEHSVGAISATNAFSSFFINFFIGLAMGANVMMARYYGANDKEKGQRVVYTSMIISLISGLIMGALAIGLTKPGLRLLNTPSELIELSSLYLMIYFAGIPFTLIYNFGASILRATGDSQRPFIVLLLSGLANIGLNLLFVVVFHMDVAGVALATVISQGLSALAIVIIMLKNKGFFEFKFKNIKFDKNEAINIMKVGVPVGIRNSLFSISNMLIQSSVNRLADEVYFTIAVNDGNGAAMSIDGFVYTAMNQVASACASFISANYGAKNTKNIKKVSFYSIIFVTMVWSVGFMICFPFREQLLSLYVTNKDAIMYGSKRMLIYLPFYFLCGYEEVLGHVLNGLGKSFLSMVTTVVGIVGFRFFWIFVVFPHGKWFTIEGLIWSYPISWTLLSSVLLLMVIMAYNQVKKKLEAEQQSQN